MKIKSIRFNSSIKCGGKQDIFFTNDLFNIVIKEQYVVIDDYKGAQTYVPMSNVSWFTPEPVKPVKNSAS